MVQTRHGFAWAYNGNGKEIRVHNEFSDRRMRLLSTITRLDMVHTLLPENRVADPRRRQTTANKPNLREFVKPNRDGQPPGYYMETWMRNEGHMASKQKRKQQITEARSWSSGGRGV